MPATRVVGVTEENLRAYCRDSVAFLLREDPRDHRPHLPHPRRVRRRRGRLRLLAHGLLGGEDRRPHDRDQPPRQGSRRARARRRARHRHAARRRAEISRRAHGPALPPLGHPRPRVSAGRGGHRARAAQHRLAPLHPPELRRLPAAQARLGRHVPHLARHPARPELGRSGLRRRLRAQHVVLRRRRHRVDGADDLQGPAGLGHRRRPERHRRPDDGDPSGLAEATSMPSGFWAG